MQRLRLARQLLRLICSMTYLEFISNSRTKFCGLRDFLDLSKWAPIVFFARITGV